MNKHNLNKFRLTRPSDAFLPAALFTATLLGRNSIAFDLFLALYMVKLCALATSESLRAAVSVQPSMRYVQGSTLLSLVTQLAGSAIALPLFCALYRYPSAWKLVACGALLNIEHVFYEYLFICGDRSSASLCHGITAGLTLTGLLLSSAPWQGVSNPLVYNTDYLLITSTISALMGLAVSLSLGGRFRPRLSPEIYRQAPMSMLQTTLFPGLCLLLIKLLPETLKLQTFEPVFAGLILYELCRTPFRRSQLESRPLIRALPIVCAVCALVSLPFVLGWISSERRLIQDLPYTCGALILSSACSIALFGSIGGRKE